MQRNFDLELVGFNGFYDTALGDFLDDQVDYALEQLDDSLSILKVNEFDCFQTMNYKQYYKDIADIIMGKFLRETTELIHDLVNLIPLDKARVLSPASYNGATDKIFIKVAISERDYYKMVGFLSYNDLLEKAVCYLDKPNLYIKFEDLTTEQFNNIFHYTLFVRLMNSDYVYDRFNYELNNKLEGKDIYDNFIEQLEEETYQDIEFAYADYVNWSQYHNELKQALDRHSIEDTDNLHSQTLWDLMDYKIVDKKLIRKEWL